MKSYLTGEELHISYFVEWRSLLWTPPVRWLLSNPERFAGKTVLELGCASGRMSCLFGLLGARVTGVDLNQASLHKASQEVQRWGLADRVSLFRYNGNPANLPGDSYDFVFTKSVLVLIPDLESFLAELAQKMTVGGELLAVENLPLGILLHDSKRFIYNILFKHRLHWVAFERKGVNAHFLRAFDRHFSSVTIYRRLGLVAAIRAIK